MTVLLLLLSCRMPAPAVEATAVHTSGAGEGARTHTPSPAAEAAEHVRGCDSGDFVACHAAALDAYYAPSPDSDAAALARFRKACDGGYAPSCNGLGAMHAEGRGVPKDEVEAVRWYRSSCAMGASTGCEHLAMALEAGRGVAQDAAAAADARARGKCLAEAAVRATPPECADLGVPR